MPESISEYERERRIKRDKLRELGVDPYGQRTEGVRPLLEIKGHYKPEMGHDAGPVVKGAGRIILKRDMGKLSFITLRDDSGDLQVGLDKKRLDETAWKVRDLLDLGDQIVVEGPLGTTNKGEITIWATSLAISSKALLPPPAKWEGLEDVELRYRQRYVDLWANPEVMRMMKLRIRVIDEIRAFFRERGFLEVETPMMQLMHGGAAAKPFKTHHNALDIELNMRIAPELYLKRLLVGGFSKVFELNRNFRNEGISPRHNPEFTMLEAYEAYGSWETMAELVESMVCHVAERVFGTLRIEHYRRGAVSEIETFLRSENKSNLEQICSSRLTILDLEEAHSVELEVGLEEIAHLEDDVLRAHLQTASDGKPQCPGEIEFDALVAGWQRVLSGRSLDQKRDLLLSRFVIRRVNLEGDTSKPAGQRWPRARMDALVGGKWKFEFNPKEKVQVSSPQAFNDFVEWYTDMSRQAPTRDENTAQVHRLGTNLIRSGYTERLMKMEPAEQLVEMYEKSIESGLIDPCFVTHVPGVAIPLARRAPEDGVTPDEWYFADVYELAINGVEISPGYSELNDPEVQAKHFEHQVGDREEQQKTDEDFLNALKYGMPPAGGMGMGIDRLLMMLTGAESIRDVILFPLMKPSGGS